MEFNADRIATERLSLRDNFHMEFNADRIATDRLSLRDNFHMEFFHAP